MQQSAKMYRTAAANQPNRRWDNALQCVIEGSHWSESYEDNYPHVERSYISLRPAVIMSEITARVAVECMLKDQGWGNKKGRVYVKQVRRGGNPSGNDAQIVCRSDIAGHDWQSVSLPFDVNIR